jgi:hypothetical protein
LRKGNKALVSASPNALGGCLAAALLTALLAGCAGRIWVDHEDASSIRLRWYTKENSIDAALARAQEHCASFGKKALLIDEFEDRDVQTAYFLCGG